MSNQFKGHTGIDRIVRAAGHSASGLRLAYAGESAFRQEVWVAAVLLPLSSLSTLLSGSGPGSNALAGPVLDEKPVGGVIRTR